MDQYNPFENSNHKISKNPFEHKNTSSDMFEPTSNKHLESWDTYKKSERKVKKYTNKQVIKEKDLNTVNTNTIKPSINIPKNLPKINVNNTERSKRLSFVIAVLIIFGTFFSTIGNFIEDSIEYDDTNYDTSIEAYEETCLNALLDIKNEGSYKNFDVSKLIDTVEKYDINLDEFTDDISTYGVYSIYIPYEDYDNRDLNHRLEYVYESTWDSATNNSICNIFIFYLEGENINDSSEEPGNILGIELVRAKDYDAKEILDTIKCGNCEYQGKSLEYYYQQQYDEDYETDE